MDYDLTKTVQGKLEWADEAIPFGTMPPSLLMTKYEETNMGNDETLYDDYARRTLTDWRPDTNQFAHEEARGRVNSRAGRLELQYYGHRGNVDTPYRPEIFDELTEREPRGINVEPDLKELTRQEVARARFVRFSPDACDQITGGGRNEARVMADNQQLFRVVRNRLAIFDRQLDGRREGLRRAFPHESAVRQQVLVQSYGDYIKDQALTPQKRANIICREILRGSRGWCEETADADFAFARYSQICRRRANANTLGIVGATDTDGKVNGDGATCAEDTSVCYKTMGLLMSEIVRGKAQVLLNAAYSDVDFGATQEAAARKTAREVADLTLIMRDLDYDGRFAASDQTRPGKTAPLMTPDHLARMVVANHLAPANHYLTAALIYKAVQEGDLRSVQYQIATDAAPATMREELTRRGKEAKAELVTGAALARVDDAEYGASCATYNYRTANVPNGDRRIRLAANDRVATESDNTQWRRPNHTNWRGPEIDDTVEDMRYGSNAHGERHGGRLGNKYMTRFIERDARYDEISLAA